MSRIAREVRSNSLAQRAHIDLKSLPDARPAQQKGARSIGQQKRDHFMGPGAPSHELGDSTWVEGGKKPGKKPLLTGSNPVHGDSFAADRINAKHHGGERVGSRNEQVSTTFRVDADNDPSTVVKTDAHVRQEVAALRTELDQLKAAVEKLAADQQKAKQPNPEGEEPVGAPVTQEEIKTQRKGLPGGHDDGDDGRAERQQQVGGGRMRSSGHDDRPAREASTGKVNMDKVLAIDQLVNPVRS